MHAAAASCRDWQPHLVIVDMDVDDGRLVQQLGQHSAGDARRPLVGLTERSDLQKRLAAFDAGADDVLAAPFAPEELNARVVALMRRAYDDALTFAPAIKLGELEIDIVDRTVRAGATPLRLTSLEQSLLYLLAANIDRVVTREEILDALWGADYVAESNVVDRLVRKLRQRLNDDWRQPRFIATVPGRGYRLLASPAVAGFTTS
jgi:two-component system KDP operon response regulator KdpE